MNIRQLFVDLCDRQARVRIRKRLDRIELGNLGAFKPVGDGVIDILQAKRYCTDFQKRQNANP
jgi:putative component of toxin-antitoxin plasmid stabilization module